MTFLYKTYWNVTFFWPVVGIVVMLSLFILSSFVFWLKPVSQKRTCGTMVGYLFCVAVCICCIIPQCKFLMNGGIYLVREKEEDALTRTGIIESVCEPSQRFPGFKSSHCYGADIVIEGEQYFAITCGKYREGDCVTIYYLPSSRFVLQIVSTDSFNHN